MFLICCVSNPVSAQTGEGDTVVVRKVTGVDTFVDESGTTYGLLGIKTPRSQAVSKSDCIDHLEGLIVGKTVVVVRDTTVAEKEGKTPQRLVYLGNNLVNLNMIKEGFAVPSSTDHQLARTFESAYKEAKEAGSGAHATERSSAIQCQGTTNSGRQCRRMTTNLSGKCWQHE